ncbi:dihydroorotase [Terrilactibacillus laevilacticus]|uniref:Dihydroorotase n=1 Tax=Terrilactibacillus laevilacticus TaxID=1380157 RepID=A0ABW5PQ17_9BACI|nr:dihydroorotase [Terrilactibacillus laevilacticus]
MANLLKNGKVFINGQLEKKDVLIKDGKIMKIEENISEDGAEIIDVQGKIVSPGFVDVHVHLREPGGEHKETIKTGTEAAARGGFTTVCAMPNTKPVPDRPERMKALLKKIEEDAVVHVLPYGAITQDLQGEALTDVEALKELGTFALTDDGVGVQTAGMMFEAMKAAAQYNIPVVAHCEDNSLIYGGVVHDGKFAREHGIKGIPNICEATQIARDVLLAEAAGAHYHVCHVSTKESVRVIRDAKRAGIHVTAEVTPHHLLLTEDDIPEVDTNYKMNPPLRAREDHQALIEGLMDGTIDIIATDHAPHSESEKAKPIEKAPFGIVGSETAFPLLYTHFVKEGRMTLTELLSFMTIKPAKTFNLDCGKIEVGKEADIVVIDLEKEQKIDVNQFYSKGKNTPFDGWNCIGWPIMTFVSGQLAWKEGVTVQ